MYITSCALMLIIFIIQKEILHNEIKISFFLFVEIENV